MPARISVVIPVFDDGASLAGAVASVRAQSRPVDELVLVDDGSTDAATLALLRELERIPPVAATRVLRQANAGVAAARHAGILAAQGELVLPLDADDELLPRAVERLEEALAAHPQAAFAHGHVRYFGQGRGGATVPRFNPYLELDQNPMLPLALLRRELFTARGLRYAPLKAFEDWGFWLACARAGVEGVCVEEPVYRYRRKGAAGLLAWGEERRGALEAELRRLFPELYSAEGRAGLKRRFAPALELAFEGPPDDPALVDFLAGQRFTDLAVARPFRTARDLLERARGRFVLPLSRAQLAQVAGARPSFLQQLALLLEARPEAEALLVACDEATLREGSVRERVAAAGPERLRLPDLRLLRTAPLAGLRGAHLPPADPVEALAERAVRRGQALLLREDFWGRAQGDPGPLPAPAALAEPAPGWRRAAAQARPLWGRVRRRLERELGAERVGRFLHPVATGLREAALTAEAVETAVRGRRLPLALGPLLPPSRRAERAWLERVPARLETLLPPLAGGRRLLFSLPWVVTGGVDRAAIELVRTLHGAGWRVTVATHVAARHEWAWRLSPFVEDHLLLGEACPEGRRVEALVEAARDRGADAFLCVHSWLGLEALPRLKAALPRLRCADWQHLDDPRPGAAFARESAKVDALLDLRLVSSEFLRERYRALGLDTGKVRVVRAGCDDGGAFDPAQVPPGHLRGALGLPLPAGAPVVGFIGRFAEEKDPLFVVQVFAALSRALAAEGRPSPSFVLVGDGPLLPAARAEAEAQGLAGRAFFLPPDADVARVLRDLSLLVLASRLEGLPLVFFEALALEVPVVTTAVQGIPELVDGTVGACVPDHADPAERARALVEAALPFLRDEELRRAAGRAGRARVRGAFSAEETRLATLAAFDALVPPGANERR